MKIAGSNECISYRGLTKYFINPVNAKVLLTLMDGKEVFNLQ